MENILFDESVAVALREAEIEEHHCPKALSAAESDARMYGIFKHWSLDYKVSAHPC